ncbi:hypothetical protein AB0395_29505 [Streptosporangium sp. NPDC051023]|uniref:hypothetical protein n=1 Tax=Streptosporangium sp. NPDC051023 TaxID=3155410 RepID=UPI00344BBBDE
MLSFGVVNKRRVAPVINRLLAFSLTLLMVSGCGTRWFPETVKVAPAVVDEASGVGRKIVQTTTGLVYGNSTYNTDILILDVGAPSFQDAVNVAHDRLRLRGWVTSKKGESVVYMHLKKEGRDNTLLIESLKSLEEYGVAQEAQVVKAIKADQAKSGTYIVLALTPSD